MPWQKSSFDRLRKKLVEPIDASSLGIFRFLFGLALVVQSLIVFDQKYIYENYIAPEFHFTFSLFDALYLKVLPGPWMYVLFAVMALAAGAIMLGLFYRWACVIYFFSFLYVFLLEKTKYNNHYYLILLIVFLFIFFNANRFLSIDKLRKKEKMPDTVPYWQVFILRMQIVIVYFFGAVAKVNYDWLMRAEPMRTTLSMHPAWGQFFQESWKAFVVSWAGFNFDLILSFLLFFRQTGIFTFSLILIFNALNHLLFSKSIGIFPLLMVFTYVLFVPPDSPRRWIKNFSRKIMNGRLPKSLNNSAVEVSRKCSFFIAWFVVIYLAIQVLVPLRQWVYPGDVNWTYEGSRFSWRMKLNSSAGFYKILIFDPKTGTSFSYLPVVGASQGEFMGKPDMLLQYIHFLRDKFKKEEIEHPVITADVMISLNSGPYHRLVNYRVNLADVEYPLFSSAWWVLSPSFVD